MEPCTSRGSSKGCWERGGSARIPCPPMGAPTFGRRENQRVDGRKWRGPAERLRLPVRSRPRLPSPTLCMLHVLFRLVSNQAVSPFHTVQDCFCWVHTDFFFKKSFNTASPQQQPGEILFHSEPICSHWGVFKQSLLSSAFTPLNPNCNLDDTLGLRVPPSGSGRQLSLKTPHEETLAGPERQFWS